MCIFAPALINGNMENDNTVNNETPAVEPQKVKEENRCEHRKCCHLPGLILNIISVIGVIILFILYFTDKNNSESSVKKISNEGLKVGFVNSDSVMENYELVKNMKAALLKKQKAATENFTAQQSAFESQVLEYQKKVKANTISIEQAANTEKLLGQKQENLLALKEELTQNLADEEYKVNIMLQDSIINFLKRYNKNRNYDYILGYAKGGGILLAGDSLDLTKDVLYGLNKEYKEEK